MIHQIFRKTMVLLTLLTASAAAWAYGQVTVVRQHNGVTYTKAGTETITVSGEDNTAERRVTITPETQYYIELTDVKAEATVDASLAQSRRRAASSTQGPEFSVITIEQVSTDADTRTSTFKFNMPDNGLDVTLTVNFRSRKQLTADMVLLSNDNGSTWKETVTFDWDGSVIVPKVQVKDDATVLAENTDYTLTVYDSKNNEVTNETTTMSAGLAKVAVTGTGKYSGTVNKSYIINPQALQDEAGVNLSKDNEAYDGTDKTATVNVPATIGLTKDDWQVTWKQKQSGGIWTVMSPQPAVTTDDDASKTYAMGKQAGEYQAAIKSSSTSNVSFDVTRPYTIAPRQLMESWLDGFTAQRNYQKGNTTGPDVTLKDGEQTLTLSDGGATGGDYTVSWTYPDGADHLEVPGEYTLTIKGCGNYQGQIVKTYTIAKQALTNQWLKLSSASATYNGGDQKPTVTLVNPTDEQPVDASDYTAEWRDANETVTQVLKIPGEYTVKVTSSSYDGSAEATFTISPYTLSDGDVKLYDQQGEERSEMKKTVYTGDVIPVFVEVTALGKVLTEGATSDYELAWYRVTEGEDEALTKVNDTYPIKEAGNYKVTVTGKNNCTGSASATFEVVDRETLPAATISFGSDAVTKETTDDAFAMTATTTGDGTVAYTSSEPSVAEVNAATGEVTIKTWGQTVITATVSDYISHNYATPMASYTLTVRKPLTNSNITINDQTIDEETQTAQAELVVETFKVDGSTHVPTITVKDGDNVVTNTVVYRNEEGQEVSADNIKELGTYTAEITFTGEYSGTAKVQFVIYLPGDTDGDKKTDLVDLVRLVNHVLEQGSNDFREYAADMDGNGTVNVQDAMLMIDQILNGNSGGASSRKTAEGTQKLEVQ